MLILNWLFSVPLLVWHWLTQFWLRSAPTLYTWWSEWNYAYIWTPCGRSAQPTEKKCEIYLFESMRWKLRWTATMAPIRLPVQQIWTVRIATFTFSDSKIITTLKNNKWCYKDKQRLRTHGKNSIVNNQ